jgi:spermidine synthase
LLRHFKPDFSDTLMIGGAGYTFPREYLRTYPSAKISVVEIDPRMTKIARRFFKLEDDPRLTIAHEDGRTYLNRVEAAKYDVVLLDAFGSLFSIPFQLTTLEAVQNIHRSLVNDGVVIFNLGSSITGPGSKFLQAEFATYQAVFPAVYLFKVIQAKPDDRLQNLIIVASKNPRAIDRASQDQRIIELLSHRYSYQPPGDLPVLTDDLAPVEYYNSFAQNMYRPNR